MFAQGFAALPSYIDRAVSGYGNPAVPVDFRFSLQFVHKIPAPRSPAISGVGDCDLTLPLAAKLSPGKVQAVSELTARAIVHDQPWRYHRTFRKQRLHNLCCGNS